MTKTTVRTMPALLSIATLAFIGTLIETSMNVAFPTLMRTFGVNMQTVQWITSGYLIVMALTMMCSAFLQRRFSLIRLFDIAAGMFIVGAILSLLAGHTFWLLILGRLVQAGCAGIAIPMMINFIIATIPTNRLGYYMSTAGMIVNLAPALGPSFGGLMTSLGSWQLIFLTTLPIVLMTWLLGRHTLQPFSQPGRKIKFQIHQFILLVVAFLLFNFSLSQIKADWVHLLVFAALVIISGTLLWRFNQLRQHDETDLLNLSLFKLSAVKFTFIIYAAIQLVNLCVNLVIPNIVQLGQHVGAFKSGLLLLPGSLLVAIINPLFGKMYDRFGGRLPICSGLLLMLLGLIGLVFCSQSVQLFWILIFYVLFSTGRTMSFGNTLTEAVHHEEKSTQTDLNALYSTGQQLAGSIGSTIGAMLLTIPIKTRVRPAILVNGQLVFGLLAGLIACIILISFKLFKTGDGIRVESSR